MQGFFDGKCRKCGGHTRGYDTDEPMICGQCGAEYPFDQEWVKTMEESFSKLFDDDSVETGAQFAPND